MQSTLTIAAQVLVIGFAVLMFADFVSGLIRLWNRPEPAQTFTYEEIIMEPVKPALLSKLEAVAVAAENALEVAEELALVTPESILKAEALARAERDRGNRELIEKLILDEPMSPEEVKDLARRHYLRGWQFYRSQETLKRKLYPNLC